MFQYTICRPRTVRLSNRETVTAMMRVMITGKGTPHDPTGIMLADEVEAVGQPAYRPSLCSAKVVFFCTKSTWMQ